MLLLLIAQLVDIYFGSVGNNCMLQLNVPPNTDGLLEDGEICLLLLTPARLLVLSLFTCVPRFAHCARVALCRRCEARARVWQLHPNGAVLDHRQQPLKAAFQSVFVQFSQTFATDFALNASANASSVICGSSASFVCDGDTDTYW